MGKRSWYEIGMVVWDLLNAIIIYIATLLIAIPAGAMVITSKIMLTVMLGIGPFFIAMLMFPVTAKWFDSWIGQVMTPIMQIALMTTVLGMGTKFFSSLTAKVLAVTTGHPIATMLEILIVTGVTLFFIAESICGWSSFGRWHFFGWHQSARCCPGCCITCDSWAKQAKHETRPAKWANGHGWSSEPSCSGELDA